MNKLKNNKGITIIHALVGIMIFSVISSIILSSAMANLKSIKYQDKYQQAYLTVSSAAEFFLKTIAEDTVTKIETSTHNNGGGTVNQASGDYTDVGINNPISKLFKSAVSTYEVPTINNAQYYLKVDNENIDDVLITIFMTEGYNLFINFSLVDTDGINYYMCACIPPKAGYNMPIIDTEILYADDDETILSETITTKYNIIFDVDNVEYTRGVYVED